MGFATKVQLIKRKESEQWYINFPSAVAQAMDFERGEVVEWYIQDRSTLVLKRPSATDLDLPEVKKGGSRNASGSSSTRPGKPSPEKGASGGRKP